MMEKQLSKEKEVFGEIHFDTDLTAYKGFFESQWAEEIFQLTDNTKLEIQALNLSASWKGISNARRLPWLMMEMLNTHQEATLNRQLQLPTHVIQGFIKRLSSIVKERYVRLSERAQSVLSEEIENIQTELIEGQLEEISTITKNHTDALWQTFTNRPEIVFGLWMSEVNAYTALYFAYEIFFIESLKILYPGEVNIRTTRLKDFFKRTNNLDLQKKYWNDAQIEKARLIRLAVAHNGRRPTKEFQCKPKNYVLLTTYGEIIIKAHDTTELYHMLKDKVKEFCEEFLKCSNA